MVTGGVEIRVQEDGLIVGVEPRLVEETVLLAVSRAPATERDCFHRERDAIYDIRDARERDDLFHALHARWLTRLGIAAPLLVLLAERPGVVASISRCLVLQARATHHESADLHDDRTAPAPHAPDAKPVLVIHLVPGTLGDPGRLRTFLKREMFHVVDMLDPGFRYDRHESYGGRSGPGNDRIRARYAILWGASVDGRLVRSGCADPGIVAVRRREIAEAFGLEGPEAGELHRRFFEPPRPTHHDILTAARAPDADRGELCTLCHLPTTDLLPPDEAIDHRIAARIRADYPAWRDGQTLCRQCADLYEARIAAV